MGQRTSLPELSIKADVGEALAGRKEFPLIYHLTSAPTGRELSALCRALHARDHRIMVEFRDMGPLQLKVHYVLESVRPSGMKANLR